MNLVETLVLNRFWYSSEPLNEACVHKVLAITGIAMAALTIISKKFYKMSDNDACFVGQLSTLLCMAALTKRDGFLCLLPLRILAGAGYHFYKMNRQERLLEGYLWLEIALKVGLVTWFSKEDPMSSHYYLWLLL